MTTLTTQPSEAAQPRDREVTTREHIRYALDYNGHLGDKVLWLLDVDWKRNCARFEGYGRIDRLFHMLFSWEWWAVAQFRVAYWAHKRLLPDLGRAHFLQRLLFLQQGALLRFCYVTGRIAEAMSGARLAPPAEIGPGLVIMHTGSCGIGAGARIGANFTLFQDANIIARRGGDYPVIGDNVTVFCGARVVGPVYIGDNARVGANAVVMHDVPANCLVVGAPARPVQAGEGPNRYPASMQVRDLVATLVQEGSLEEVAPGRYRDSATGTEFEAVFPDASGERQVGLGAKA